MGAWAQRPESGNEYWLAYYGGVRLKFASSELSSKQFYPLTHLSRPLFFTSPLFKATVAHSSWILGGSVKVNSLLKYALLTCPLSYAPLKGEKHRCRNSVSWDKKIPVSFCSSELSLLGSDVRSSVSRSRLTAPRLRQKCMFGAEWRNFPLATRAWASSGKYSGPQNVYCCLSPLLERVWGR